MNPEEKSRILTAGCMASEMSSICILIGEVLGANPMNVRTAEAIEGVARIANQIADNLLNLAEPD